MVDAGGRFLSYCIGWLDANGFGHFELVGRAAADQPLKMAIARVSVSLRELSGQPLKTSPVQANEKNQNRCRFLDFAGAFRGDDARRKIEAWHEHYNVGCDV